MNRDKFLIDWSSMATVAPPPPYLAREIWKTIGATHTRTVQDSQMWKVQAFLPLRGSKERKSSCMILMNFLAPLTVNCFITQRHNLSSVSRWKRWGVGERDSFFSKIVSASSLAGSGRSWFLKIGNSWVSQTKKVPFRYPDTSLSYISISQAVW